MGYITFWSDTTKDRQLRYMSQLYCHSVGTTKDRRRALDISKMSRPHVVSAAWMLYDQGAHRVYCDSPWFPSGQILKSDIDWKKGKM